MRRLIGIALAVLAAAVVAAGCGDSKDSDTLSKTEYVAQGNAICEKGNQDIQKAAEAMGSGRPSKADLEKFASEDLIPSVRSQIDDLEALKPPEEIQDDVDAFLKQANADYAKAEADPSLATSDENLFAETNKLATGIGLTACANDG